MTDMPTKIRTKAEEALENYFAALPENDPIRDARADAFAAFLERGLPHRRIEDWKYTDLRSLMRDAPPPAPPARADASRQALARADVFAAVDRARIVFVNGHFVPSLCDLAGIDSDVDFASFGRFLAQGGAILDRSLDPAESPVFALNSAFVRDGAVLRIRNGAKLARPLELVHVFADPQPGLQTLRHQIAVGAGAEATILQTYSGPDGVGYQTNVVTEVQAGEGADVRWVFAQEEGDEAIHLSLFLPRLSGNVRFEPFVFAAGAVVSRNELRLALEAEGSQLGLRGATIARGRQHMDTTLVVDHAAPRCGGQEYFKAAMDGQSQGVFQGKIIVEPGAQKTDSKMMSRALLLSETAEFANKPELEIFADDVVCGHGATCGRIDENMLFFLRSRGIDKAEAERMLVQAFLADAIEMIGDDGIVTALENRTRRWLGMAAESHDEAEAG
ncbi:MAG TPA: Fe-S cluster assembly protein SufD [Propylenella sp.]|nr:Fe-S cluster assembly protein SufD [Propylenella sp.]